MNDSTTKNFKLIFLEMRELRILRITGADFINIEFLSSLRKLEFLRMNL